MKYYHAWLLADAICNASGLGFNGYTSSGKAKWDLISNVDIIKFEVCVILYIETVKVLLTKYLQISLA